MTDHFICENQRVFNQLTSARKKRNFPLIAQITAEFSADFLTARPQDRKTARPHDCKTFFFYYPLCA
jgi:hypothetical protein